MARLRARASIASRRPRQKAAYARRPRTDRSCRRCSRRRRARAPPPRPWRPIPAAWSTGSLIKASNKRRTIASACSRTLFTSGCRYIRVNRKALMSRSAASMAASMPDKRPPGGGDRFRTVDLRFGDPPAALADGVLDEPGDDAAGQLVDRTRLLEPGMERVDLSHQAVDETGRRREAPRAETVQRASHRRCHARHRRYRRQSQRLAPLSSHKG